MPRPPAPPCIECGAEHYSKGRCRSHYESWLRLPVVQNTRCEYCKTITQNPKPKGQRHGRKWELSGGRVVYTCRKCLPKFLEEHQEPMLEALARAITVTEDGRWLIESADEYPKLTVSGIRAQPYAHHVVYGLFHGGWKADEQVHHRSQDPHEVSPWKLQAVAIRKHEGLKGREPIHDAVPIAKLTLLEEFAAQHGLPLPWHEQPVAPEPKPKPRTTMFELFAASQPALTEPEPITAPAGPPAGFPMAPQVPATTEHHGLRLAVPRKRQRYALPGEDRTPEPVEPAETGKRRRFARLGEDRLPV